MVSIVFVIMVIPVCEQKLIIINQSQLLLLEKKEETDGLNGKWNFQDDRLEEA